MWAFARDSIRYGWLVSAFVLWLGCQKEEPFRSYIRLTVDGVRLECDYYIKASSYYSPTQLLSVVGYWKHKTPQEGNIEIELYGFDNTTGHKPFDPPSNVRVLLFRTDGSGGSVEDAYFASTQDVNFHVLEVSERYIKGTFAMVARMNTGPGTYETLTITDGEFHIDRRL